MTDKELNELVEELKRRQENKTFAEKLSLTRSTPKEFVTSHLIICGIGIGIMVIGMLAQ